MNTIIQTPPFLDTVVSGLSVTYENQLTAMNYSGVLTFVTTVGSCDLVIGPQGAVTTNGVLEPDVYPASGTVHDTSGNTGVWAFSLTVESAFTPQTNVTPVVAPSPNGVEVQVPFQIDLSTGGVAQLTDYYSIMQQHVLTILMTNILERVMLPTYGVGLETKVFSSSNELTVPLLQSELQNQLSLWEPSISIKQLSIQQNPGLTGSFTVLVQYYVLPFNDVNIATVLVGGSVPQVVSP